MKIPRAAALAGSLILILCFSGCASVETVRAHHGRGTIRAIHGSPDEVLAAADKYLGGSHDIKESTAVYYLISSTWAEAVFVSPMDANGDTKTEVLCDGLQCAGMKQETEDKILDGIAKDLALLHLKRGTAAVSPTPAPSAPAAASELAPPRRLAPDPLAFAVVIGVERYSNELPEAKFAERDAESVRASLVALGYPDRNIKFMTGARATKGNLEAYIEDWLPRNAKADGKVFVYFSGHGAPDPKSNQAYLVPFDGNPNYLDKTAYPVKKLYASLNRLRARQIVVALDSCFSGAGGRSVLADGARPLVTQVDSSVSRDGKITLFAAASPQEVTSTLNEQGHGMFTYYFLKGLAGAAADREGAVTARGLYDYLKPQVQDAASRQNRDQTPLLEGVSDRELVRFK